MRATSGGRMRQEREHFDRIAGRYADASQSWTSLTRQVVERVSPLVVGKTVLDVGNGGFFAYDPRSAGEVTVLDISPAMLDRIEISGVRKVVGDARDLAGIEPESVDVLLFVFALHHICGRNVRDSYTALGQVLEAARERLRPGGLLVVAEPLLQAGYSRWSACCFPSHALRLGYGVSR